LFLCWGLSAAAPYFEAEYQHLFTKWMNQYQKNYEMEAFFHRYSIFKENVNWIEENNARNLSYTVGLNQFADLTSKEFAGRNGLVKSSPPSVSNNSRASHTPIADYKFATDLDWRSIGAVLIPRDQGQCGSCYAFSAVSAVESHWGIQHGMMYALSEQELVDCSSSEGNMGCVGGQPDNSLHYMMKHGIAKHVSYPYTGTVGGCQNAARSPVIVKGSTGVGINNEAGMIAAVNIGPLIIQISAGEKIFQFYSAGIIDDAAGCGYSIDHAVNVIGYGIISGIPYWTIRNSWGASWGENGFVRIVRNKNMCEVAYEPEYPLV